jgi:hypothetical protein
LISATGVRAGKSEHLAFTLKPDPLLPKPDRARPKPAKAGIAQAAAAMGLSVVVRS